MTFSQLLVKAHRNEEEETASKLVNKSAVAEPTLEERVDRLMVRSNQSNQSSPGPSRDNRDIVIIIGAPPLHQNPRSRGDFTNNPCQSSGNIRQNLRGPEPSAAGPFGESNGSRPIQCFKYRGWGHPKCPCPSQLNYTGGGSGMGTSLPDSGPLTQGSSSQPPVSSAIDMQISQVVQRYHNLDLY